MVGEKTRSKAGAGRTRLPSSFTNQGMRSIRFAFPAILNCAPQQGRATAIGSQPRPTTPGPPVSIRTWYRPMDQTGPTESTCMPPVGGLLQTWCWTPGTGALRSRNEGEASSKHTKRGRLRRRHSRQPTHTLGHGTHSKGGKAKLHARATVLGASSPKANRPDYVAQRAPHRRPCQKPAPRPS